MNDSEKLDDVTIDPNIAAGVWLLPATNGLCDDAKDRIEREVREHFVAKYNEEMERRANAFDALDATLLAMGNEKAANRAYRRKYLTTKQTKYFDHMKLLRRGEVFYPWILVILMAIAYVAQIFFSTTMHMHNAIFASWMMMLMTAWPLQPTLQYFFGGRPAALRTASMISCLAQTVVAICLAVLASRHMSTAELIFGLVTFPALLIAPLHDIFLLRKARRCEYWTTGE